MNKLVMAAAMVFAALTVSARAVEHVLPDITITAIGHTARNNYNGENNFFVRDQATSWTVEGGGAFVVGTYVPGDVLVQRFLAPVGHRFVFSAPAPRPMPESTGFLAMEPSWSGVTGGNGTRFLQPLVEPGSLGGVSGQPPAVDPLRRGGINGSPGFDGLSRPLLHPAAGFLLDGLSDFSFTSATARMVVPQESPGGSGPLVLSGVDFQAGFGWSVFGPPIDTLPGQLLTIQPIPEPASAAAVLLVLATSAVIRTRRNSRSNPSA